MENYREYLNEIDMKCIDENLHFYDLRSLYESTVPNLSPEDKQELKKVLDSTNDPEIIAAALTAKATKDKNESLEEDEQLVDKKVWYDVFIESPGGVKHDLTEFDAEVEAEDFCNQHDWHWVDENGFDWDLNYEEKSRDWEDWEKDESIKESVIYRVIDKDTGKPMPGGSDFKTYADAKYAILNARAAATQWDDVKYPENGYDIIEVNESLNETRSLAKPIKKDMKNAYKAYDSRRDFVRKFNDDIDANIDSNIEQGKFKYDDRQTPLLKQLLHKKEPEFNDYTRGAYREPEIETDEYPFYVTYYQETPYYHPEEGGYYVAGLSAVSSMGFDNKADAIQYAEEMAHDFRFQKQNDRHWDLGSRYIGNNEHIWIETAKDYLSHEKGDRAYESLNEEYSYNPDDEYQELFYKKLTVTSDDSGYFVPIYGYEFKVYTDNIMDDLFELSSKDDSDEASSYYDSLSDLDWRERDAKIDEYLKANFNRLFEKYEEQLLDKYEYDAQEQADEDYNNGLIESLNEAFYESDFSVIPLVDEINFVNKKNNGLPGIINEKEFVKVLDGVGKDKFKVRTNRFGTNISNADIKDSWMSLKRKGWNIGKAWDSSLPGFNEVYVCEKVFNESLNEDYFHNIEKLVRDATNKYELDSGEVIPAQFDAEYINDMMDEFENYNYSVGWYMKDPTQDSDDLSNQIYEFHRNDEPLEEDTIKQNGKWVNKGKEGTHGAFKTKKAADAQRKAMFANGYKESLDETLDDYIVANDDIQFDTAENIVDIFGEDSEYLRKLYDLGLDDMSGDFYIPEGTRLKFVGETTCEHDGSTMYQLQIDGDPNKEILVCDYTVDDAIDDGTMVIEGSGELEESLSNTDPDKYDELVTKVFNNIKPILHDEKYKKDLSKEDLEYLGKLISKKYFTEGLQDIQNDFANARKNWDSLGFNISFDDALEKYNDKYGEERFYAKPIYDEDDWNQMVNMFSSKNESVQKRKLTFGEFCDINDPECNLSEDELQQLFDRDSSEYSEDEIDSMYKQLYGESLNEAHDEYIDYSEKKAPTWADLKYAELMEKGQENWDIDDYDAYNYILNAWGETDYYNESLNEASHGGTCNEGYLNADSVAHDVYNSIRKYGFKNLSVNVEDEEWLTIDVKDINNDSINKLLDKLLADGYDAEVEDHFIQIFVGDLLESLNEDIDDEEYDSEFEKGRDGCFYKQIAHKMVYDSDGFTTDYTLYMKAEPVKDRFDVYFVTVFGDSDIYRPDDGNYDYETDDLDNAIEWFDSYNGFEDDEFDESLQRGDK